MKTRLRRLFERVWYLPCEERTDRPVLTYLRGDARSLAVDAGNSPAHLRHFYAELERNGLTPPDFTVVTHWHWDHTFALCAAGGATIACRRTNDKLRAVSAWAWDDESMRGRLASGEDIAFCDACIRLEYPDLSDICVCPARIGFEGGMTIDLGGVTAALSERDSPHSRDHTMVYVPEYRLLIAGDGCGEDDYENGGAYEKARLAAYRDALEAIPFTTFVGGHGEPESRESVMSYMADELARL